MRENPKFEARNSKSETSTNDQNPKSQTGHSMRRQRFCPLNLFRASCFGFRAFLLVAVALAVLLGGCAGGPAKLTVCPGKPSAAEALKVLTDRAASAVPLRANGQAMLTYHVPGKKKTERHNLPLELRFEPPGNIYIQGSIAVDARAVILGANDREFWLALSPKEMSAYYIGQWDEVRDFEGLMMSPRVVLEALGLVAESNGEPDAGLWSLENKGAYDILVRRDETGRPVRRVHVYSCDYAVHKIEYFDGQGRVVAVAQLGDYKDVAEGFRVPTKMRVVSTNPDGRRDTMEISLAGVRTTQFKDQQRQVLFSPPPSGKFDNIYRYQAGRWVPE
jgi:hypothetical protein